MSRKSIWYILAGFMLPLSVIVIFYVCFDAERNAISSSMHYAIKRSGEKDNILFLGNSRTLKDINPIRIQSITGLRAYNLGLDGSTVVYYNMIFRKYLETHPRPDYIFINADFTGMDQNFLPYNYPDYYTYLGDPTIARCLQPYSIYYAPGSKWKRWYTHLQKINSSPDDEKIRFFYKLLSKGANFDRDEAKGFQPFYSRWEDWPHDDGKLYATVIYHPEAFEILQEIIRECQRDSIRLILLAPPFYRDYKSKIANYQQYIDTMQSLSERYKVPYWNYQDLTATDTTLYFYNIEHLNSEGADIFSDMLGEDIKAYVKNSDHVPDMKRVYTRITH